VDDFYRAAEKAWIYIRTHPNKPEEGKDDQRARLSSWISDDTRKRVAIKLFGSLGEAHKNIYEHLKISYKEVKE
jgi:hypothetical protein